MFTSSISSTNKRNPPSIKTHQNQNPYKNKNRGTQVVKLSVPFLFSSAHSAVPEPCVPRSGCRANQNAASCQEKESMEWRNGTERLQTFRFFGAAWLEIANQCCENRIPYAVSLVNPQFAIFPEKGVCRRGFSVFSTFCPKNPLCFGRKPTCFLLLFKVVLVIIVTQDFVGRFSFLSTPCSQSCRRRQFRTVSPPENRLCSAVFQRLSS